MRLLVKTSNECTGAVAAGSITHDAYQKALARLLRDLRVERA